MSAVILAVIVVMWAVVLVPMWLRRHDAATESRSVDRFSTAMRVLSRRQPADRRYVLMPRRESAPQVHVSGASARSSRPARPTAPVRPATPGRPGRRTTSLAARRRRSLLALAGLVGFTFVLAVAGVIGVVLQGLVDLVLVAYVAHLRSQAKRAAALAARRRRAAGAARTAPAGAATAAVGTAPVADRRVRFTPPAPVGDPVVGEPLDDVEPAAAVAEPAETVASAAPAPAPAELQEQVGELAATGTDDGAWEPVPVPRPTYTMKPPAPPRRYPPVNPETPAAQDTPAPAPGRARPAPQEAADADDDGQLDEILTHRWAVND